MVGISNLFFVFEYAGLKGIRAMKHVWKVVLSLSPESRSLIRHFKNKKETYAMTSGTVAKDNGKNIGQKLTDTSPVTIPETIAGHISAPVPFSFLKTLSSLFYLTSNISSLSLQLQF